MPIQDTNRSPLPQGAIGLAGGTNLNAYAGNDPATFTDPFGLCPWCLGAIAGAIAGGVGRATYNYLNDRPIGQGVFKYAAGGALLGASLGASGSVLLARTAAAGTEIAGGGAAAGAAFRHGQRVKDFVETAGGKLEVGFKVVIDGAKLHLRDFSVFGADAERVNVGTGEMVRMTRQLIDAAKAQGFEQITISGVRISGANPGHVFEVVRDLTK